MASSAHGYAADLLGFGNYFFFADGTPKTSSFGLGNWTGLAALVVVAVGIWLWRRRHTPGDRHTW